MTSEQAKAIQRKTVAELLAGVALWDKGEVTAEELHALVAYARTVLPDDFFGVPPSAPQVTIADKVAHVKRAGQTRNHECHWPGCTAQVPPAMWGCKAHWFKLPKRLRDRVWATYRPGQEETGTPSANYVAVAREVQEWIRSQGARP